MTNCAYRPPLDKDHITDGLRAGARRVLSRCGEGAGWGGLDSATLEERPNEVPRDGAMNHYQLCYI